MRALEVLIDIEGDGPMSEIKLMGVDLAKNVFVRPASRLSFCFTGGI